MSSACVKYVHDFYAGQRQLLFNEQQNREARER